jgi:arylsulfatase A-like enzyme
MERNDDERPQAAGTTTALTSWLRPSHPHRRLLTRLIPPRPGEAEVLGTPGALLLQTLWFGLTTGLLELVLVLLRRRFSDMAVLGALQLNRHAVWMIPLSDVMIVGGLGLFFVAARLLGVRSVGLVAPYGFCFLSTMALALVFPGLTTIAYAIISGGIAAQLAPRLVGRGRRFRRVMRISVPGLAAILALLLLTELGHEVLEEELTLARLPQAGAGRPNVLLVVLDTVRAESLSLHGYARPTTPHLKALATRGIRFDQARATAPWTLPSHASMFTGRWPHELSARVDRPLDATYPTLAEYLRDRGYATAGFVANTFFCNHWYGLGRGFVHYEDTAVTPVEIIRSSGLGRRLVKGLGSLSRNRPNAYFQRKDAPTINQEVLRWLDHRPDDRPFFAFLNYYDAHDPYLTEVEPTRAFGLRPRSKAELALLQNWHLCNKTKLTPHDIALARDCYDDCIAYLDGELGKLFEGLERRGLLASTLVVVTSDHGEEFNERNGFGHGHSLHHEVAQVPLMIVAPSLIPSGRVVTAPVSLRDLPATIVDLLQFSDGSPLPGRSLARHWSERANAGAGPGEPLLSEVVDREPVWPASWRLPKSLIVDEMLYLLNRDGSEELYNLANDRAEKTNLASSESSQRDLERFRVALKRLVPDEAAAR